MILSDNSDIVKNLRSRQKNIFMEPREKMKCALPDLVVAKCINFVKVFNNTKNAGSMKNILHNKKWKESETDLVKIMEYILGIIAICLSTAERQSIASKAQRNLGIIGERIGKKPDIMGLLEQDEKIIELLYTESSRIVCSNSKKSDDEIAGITMYLNILVNDLASIPRYFHLDHAEIPLSSHQSCLKSLIRLLLTLRNALEQATSHPPRNVNPSLTVSTLPYNN
ncbi:15860_t:CDS:2 [Funneliformis mosseae]|uniref:15860_t:CDS:1 n=1 Tax=Funneliformis mosseae TaxID=27381 RepID=A0A9N9FUC7_FUNMO|nr:15860_t:CDS:2 [Funneliformis mosseae]